MWSLRILSGELAGKIFPLKDGTNSIGRSSKCDVALQVSGVSKSHAKIEVRGNLVMLSDADSRNGTFVDGVAIKSKPVSPGQKISFFNLICEIIPAKTQQQMVPQQMPQSVGVEQAMVAYQGNLAESQGELAEYGGSDGEVQAQGNSGKAKGIQEHAQQYLDEIIMPGAYRLAEWMEFKNLVMLFCLVFVVLVTSLSTIPLTQILKKRIEKTSQQRAMTIARLLANKNRPSIQAGQLAGVQTSYVQNEPGVDKSFIVDLDGRVLAPPALAQQFLDLPFISQARRLGKEVVQQIDDNTIGASAPILAQTLEGTVAPLAYSIIIYDMGTLAVDDGQTLSLFVQTLFIALIIGGIVFFFLYKIVLFPIVSINSQLSRVLRKGDGNISSTYNFEELQSLIQNLQTLVSRSAGGGNSFSQEGEYEHERTQEASGLANLVGFSALAVDTSDMRISSNNIHFQEQIAGGDWTGSLVSEISDQSLKLNIEDVVERCRENPNLPATDSLEIEGTNYSITGQAVYGSKAVAYVVISFVPADGGE